MMPSASAADADGGTRAVSVSPLSVAEVPFEWQRYFRFCEEHGTLVLPHKNVRTGVTLSVLNVFCDACDTLVAPSAVHGVINDYPNCTEVRFVTGCHCCNRLLHNVVRFTPEGILLMCGGRWSFVGDRQKSAALRRWLSAAREFLGL
jgi:hypothetical protein